MSIEERGALSRLLKVSRLSCFWYSATNGYLACISLLTRMSATFCVTILRLKHRDYFTSVYCNLLFSYVITLKHATMLPSVLLVRYIIRFPNPIIPQSHSRLTHYRPAVPNLHHHPAATAHLRLCTSKH